MSLNHHKQSDSEPTLQESHLSTAYTHSKEMNQAQTNFYKHKDGDSDSARAHEKEQKALKKKE